VKSLRKVKGFLKNTAFTHLLFTWLPYIGDVFAMVAGLMKLSFRYFSILVFIGKFGRYFAVGYLTAYLAIDFCSPAKFKKSFSFIT